MNKDLQLSIGRMTERIAEILAENRPSIYLYGSAVMDDFQPGWSDIDILVLTQRPIAADQSQELLYLRQRETGIPYAHSFEGGMLSADAFLSGASECAVYWGTSGERIANGYQLDSFGMAHLLTDGVLLVGEDVRPNMQMPTYDQLRGGVARHYQTIRRYARQTDRSIYSYGWLLDIARCIYTLRTGRIIAKTAAARWALDEKICPEPDVLLTALEIRQNPLKYRDDPAAMAIAEALGPHVQRFTDVLESEFP